MKTKSVFKPFLILKMWRLIYLKKWRFVYFCPRQKIELKIYWIEVFACDISYIVYDLKFEHSFYSGNFILFLTTSNEKNKMKYNLHIYCEWRIQKYWFAETRFYMINI